MMQQFFRSADKDADRLAQTLQMTRPYRQSVAGGLDAGSPNRTTSICRRSGGERAAIVAATPAITNGNSQMQMIAVIIVATTDTLFNALKPAPR
jgi:hypothetical protein